MSTGHQVWECAPVFSPGTVVEPCWFAVQTRSRHEKFVASQLKQQGITTFLPLASEVRRWSDRRKLVQLPLFSGYIFVRVVPLGEVRVRILRTNGVVSLVGARGEGIPIPDSEIESLQKLLISNVSFVDCPFVPTGQRVRIRGGCMDGIEGILLERNGNRSLIISVETVERSLALRVEGFEVETIWTSAPSDHG